MFCDREKELGCLLKNVKNDVDTTLISQRRIGKTGLICRLFDEIKMKKIDILPIYIDIYASRSLQDFVKLTAEAVMKSSPKSSSLSGKFMTFIKSLRPQLTFDPMTGEPQIQLTFQSYQEKEYTVRGLFDFLDKQNKPILIAYDEFQQILEYPEKNIEELLRTCIQPLKNVHFIFCGSKKHLITEIFTNANRPFFSSTSFIALGRIPADVYAAFIRRIFASRKRNITDDALSFILDWTCRCTYYTQYLCHSIFATGKVNITLDDVKTVSLQILQQNAPVYLQYRQMLTAKQWNFLIAVAKEHEIPQIPTKEFLNRYGISSIPAAKTLIASLYGKDLIIDDITKDVTTYSVYDVFMSRWLEREY